jgi:hypothetical protein
MVSSPNGPLRSSPAIYLTHAHHLPDFPEILGDMCHSYTSKTVTELEGR